MKGFPPPAPLAFTPSKFQEGFETQVTQLERSKDAELFEKAIEVAESEVEKVLMTSGTFLVFTKKSPFWVID